MVDGELSFLPCPDCGRPLSVFDSKKNPGEKLYLCTNAKGHNGQEKVWFHMMDGKLVPSQRSFSVPPRDADSIDCPMCHKGYLFKVTVNCFIISKIPEPSSGRLFATKKISFLMIKMASRCRRRTGIRLPKDVAVS